jgi:CHAT domain-containing protein
VDGAPGSDGYLTAGVIGGTSIQAQLVTLSACDTGRGQLVPREGVLGLARAFLEAGAAAVLATLWPVEDAATLELMRAFYPRLARGEERSAALTAAMRELRDAALARRCGRTRFSGPHSS